MDFYRTQFDRKLTFETAFFVESSSSWAIEELTVF